jgi:hypothetical protein
LAPADTPCRWPSRQRCSLGTAPDHSHPSGLAALPCWELLKRSTLLPLRQPLELLLNRHEAFFCELRILVIKFEDPFSGYHSQSWSNVYERQVGFPIVAPHGCSLCIILTSCGFVSPLLGKRVTQVSVTGHPLGLPCTTYFVPKDKPFSRGILSVCVTKV